MKPGKHTGGGESAASVWRVGARTLAGSALLAASLALVGSCGSGTGAASGENADQDPPGVFFPKQEPASGEVRAYPQALAYGELVLVDDCLRLDEDGGTSYVPVWPPDHDLSAEDGELRILDGEGRTKARVGERVELSGGAVLAYVSKSLQHGLQKRCPGPYWTTSGMEPES